VRTCAILAALVVTPVSGAADDRSALRPLDTKAKDIAVVVPKDGAISKPTQITTAGELEKSPLFAEVAVVKVKKEVNFEKEKLVVFAWTGSVRDTVTGERSDVNRTVQDAFTGALFQFNELTFVEFKCTQGITSELRQHVQVFIVPKGAPVLVHTEPVVVDEIALKDLKIIAPEKPLTPPKSEIITSTAELAESPALKSAADEIKKLVDFDRQKLVFVAWLGSSADRCLVGTKLADDKLVVAFLPRPGSPTDLHMHMRLFVVPKGIKVEITGD
jgi:hypothetical protein